MVIWVFTGLSMRNMRITGVMEWGETPTFSETMEDFARRENLTSVKAHAIHLP